tara:strand:+ start:452 stop:1165 length:714 start_codon:yes stop_codon:yes gene_type:complete
MPYIGKAAVSGIRKRFTFLASAGATSISGADANGQTLTFDDGTLVDVFLNGVKLKTGEDYNTSTANTIAGLTALNLNDEVEILAYDTFSSADTVSKRDGGTFDSAISVTGNITSTGDLTLSTGSITLSAASATIDAHNTPIWNTSTQSTSFTASAGNQYFIDTSSTAVTLTLPSSAIIGDEIRVLDASGTFDTNNLTIARNSHKIQRDASDLTVTTEGAGFALVYHNSTNGWLLKER